VSEAKLIASRSHEIVLTGIDISSYKIDGRLALNDLMVALKEIPAVISLGSLEVNVITDELLQTLSQMNNFSPHFHLSLQSGDNEVLRRMNRHYTADEFYDRVMLIKKYFPNANLTTDVIVGFAGESEEQFENTKNFIIKCGFSYVHIFPYSKRKGTRAYNMEDLPNSVKKARVDILEEVNRKLKNDYLSRFIGHGSTMLAEEKKTYWEGFSHEYIRCYVSDELESGKVYNIEFTEIYEDGMKVRVIQNTKE
jgi:threonylcarbamoyladenosine tRNA methylthiotransferase MtaB